MTVNLSEAKAHLGRYVAKARAGEIITICDRNKPVAELHPPRLPLKPQKIKIGVLKGAFEVPDDFNDPLPDFEVAFYGKPRKSRGKK
jgi:prevent-host-death family protein